MATNYCDLTMILTHLNLCHQYIVNSSQWMENMNNRYLQAVISLLDISAHYSIEIAIHLYFIFAYIVFWKMTHNIDVCIIYVSLIIFSNLHTPVRESHGKGNYSKVGIITLLPMGHSHYNL